MNPTTTRTAVSLALTGRTLRHLLSPVLAHTSGPNATEAYMFNRVCFETSGQTLYLSATDRFTIGVIRHRLTGRQPALCVCLDAEPLRMACAFTDDHDHVLLSLRQDGARITTLSGYGPQHQPDKTDLTAHPRHWPDWRTLLLTPLAEPPTFPPIRTAYQPEHLARFTTAPGTGPLVFRPTTPKLTLITRGTCFLGAIATPAIPAADDITNTTLRTRWNTTTGEDL